MTPIDFNKPVNRIKNNHGKSHIVKPVFFRNLKFSEVAQQSADELGVMVVQNFHLRKYPQIKCNNLFRDCDLLRFPSKKKISSKKFSASSTPLTIGI
jgi:hypothetical protein